MSRKTNQILCLLLIILMSYTSLCIAVNLTIATGTEIKVINPETGDGNFIYYSNTTAIGTRFNATVWIYDVTDLFAFQIYLMVDDTLLNITNAWIPRTDPNYIFYGKTTLPLQPAFYDKDGNGVNEAVLIGETILTGEPASGSGIMAIIELEIIYTPETGEESAELNINNPDTFILDLYQNDIPAMITNGVYRIIGAPAPPIPPATLYVSPSRIVDPALTPSRSFGLDINLADATNLYELRFKIGYDPTIMAVENVTLGILPVGTTQINIDHVGGVLALSSLISPPFSGNGTLMTVYFHVQGIGATDIDIFDTELFDENGEALPHTSEDGFFNNIFMAKLYVDPEEIISEELLPSYIFSINITIDDVENLYGYEFTLNYNTEMLTCIGIYIYPIHNQTAFTPTMQISDREGRIWINVTFYDPAVPITTYTPEPLVKIIFIVEKPGSSVLDLTDTSLVNSTGELIPHIIQDGYVQTLIHDVAVTQVTAEPDWVYEGWIVNITVTVKNLGNVSETFDVNVYYDNKLIATQTVNNLLPGQEKILQFSWNTTGVEEGNYTIKGEATIVSYEFNTENNVYIDGKVEVRRLIRDVAVVDLSAYPNAVYPGWTVNISVTVRNEGNLTETFTVTLYYNKSQIGIIQVVNLTPNEERTFMYVWNTTGWPECSNYTISAEAEHLMYEIDLEDNYLTDGYVKIKIYGDINGDGKVDIRDVAVVAAAFGSFPGHERWNPDADLNRDGTVNIRDVAIVAGNFGKTC